MKVDGLSLDAIDWEVAKCEGVINGDELDIGFILEGGYTPSTNWEQGGPIIEREKIAINYSVKRECWFAENFLETQAEKGDTPLIAAMRCYVASKQGEQDANEDL